MPTTTKPASIFEAVDLKRKQWLPISPTASETVQEGAVDTISKCFALRILEIPVKNLILDGLSRKESNVLGDSGRKCLLRNTEDEEKHDTALNNCLKVFSNYNKQYEVEAETILTAWQNHPDEPILKTFMIENGILFVLLLLNMRYGGASLRVTSRDISADEINHVQSHRYASKLLGSKPSKSLDELRKATISWLVSNLNVEGDYKERYIKSSDSLVYRGVAPELKISQAYSVPAFFEHRSDTLPYYTK